MYVHLRVHIYTCTWEVSARVCFLCTSTEEDDYTALTGTVTLTPTNDQQCVSVVIEDDSVLEETESLTVSLSPTGVVDSVQVSQPTTTIVITDNDCKRLIITAYEHMHYNVEPSYIFLCPSVVDVGFVQSVYTSSEHNMSVMVCVEVKQGTLGISVNFSLTTHDESAQGTHAQCHASN